ncbi:MAG: P-II family nitrogen regulator [Chloroflexi bacterium]|nr:MAG: P-II family nitrogen regulator [Chloroflexota bacterium]
MFRKIEAYIRDEKLDEVKQALYDIGIVGMNIIHVEGHGRQGGIELSGRSGTYRVDMLPRVQLNIVLSTRNLEKAIEVIQQTAVTGRQGDGVIFIYPVEDVVRIRTGERGPQALSYRGDIDDRSR